MRRKAGARTIREALAEAQKTQTASRTTHKTAMQTSLPYLLHCSMYFKYPRHQMKVELVLIIQPCLSFAQNALNLVHFKCTSSDQSCQKKVTPLAHTA